jgi:hypothetical protein
MDDYKPEYLDGMVSVVFTKNSEKFNKSLINLLGYEKVNYPYSSINKRVMYKVPIGEEEEAVARFESENFVTNATRVDKKYYDTLEILDHIIRKVQSLRDEYPIPDEIFNIEMKQMIQYYESLKK